MKKTKRPFFTGLILLLTVLANLATPATAFADDITPPPATQEPIVEETSTTEPEVEEVSTPEPTAADQTPSEPAPVSEILEQLPEDTQLVVLDENENLEPLVTQAAAEILTASDPMWCPAGVAPIANTDGCTASYTDFASLLLYLDANEPTQAGVIWIEKGYDSGVNDAGVTSFFLDGAVNLLTMKNYALTLQGGWNGDSAGTINHADPSEFNANLNIVDWNGNVTLNDLLITETTGAGINFSLVPGIGPGYSPRGAGLAITTTGNVKLNHITSTDNNTLGAIIYNTSGSGTVSIQNGNFSDNGVGVYGGMGIYVLSDGDISLKNITASRNHGEGGFFTNSEEQDGITLTGLNQFYDNRSDGLAVFSLGSIYATNIYANRNEGAGAYLHNWGNTANHGVTVHGTNEFNDNGGFGVSIQSSGDITLNNITANGNGMEGALLINGQDGTPDDITFTGTNVFHGNGGEHTHWYFDLYIDLNHNIAQYRSVATDFDFSLLSDSQLPADLPHGTTFISALQVLQTDDIIVVSFAIPDGMQDADLAILYWDGTAWLDLNDAEFNDGREVSDGGHFTGNGYFQATVNFGGTFVLVQKEFQEE